MSRWGDRIKELREAKGWKKAELARRCGVSGPTVTEWENGEIKEIEGSRLAKLATVFNTSMDDVWGRSSKINRSPTTASLGKLAAHDQEDDSDVIGRIVKTISELPEVSLRDLERQIDLLLPQLKSKRYQSYLRTMEKEGQTKAKP